MTSTQLINWEDEITQPEDGIQPVSEYLPDSFWKAHPTLTQIQQAAHSQGAPAGPVLAHCLSILTAYVPLSITVSQGGTLNSVFAVVGYSGAGKSQGAKVARQLMANLQHPKVRVGVPLSTGEGMAQAYLKKKTRVRKSDGGQNEEIQMSEQVQAFTGVQFVMSEGGNLVSEASRKGSKVMTSISEMWSADSTGQQNGREENTRQLEAYGYRFSLIINFQPGNAAILLDPKTVEVGTPQRFVWVKAMDPLIPDYDPDRDWRIQPLNITVPKLLVDHDIRLPGQRERAMREANIQRSRTGSSPDNLDSHEGLAIAKLAGLLVLLFGETEMTEQHWQLAETFWRTSKAVRASVVSTQRRGVQAIRDARARDAAEAALAVEERKTIARAESFAKRCAKRGPQTFRDLQRSGNGLKRSDTDAAIAYAVEVGLIKEDGEHYVAVDR